MMYREIRQSSVLNDLADKDRLIGIISHVNELKEQIDHKLVVKRTKREVL